jgi:hypothetical protein
VQENNMLVLESPGPALTLKTVSKSHILEDAEEQRLAAIVCSFENKDECLMCGS